MSVRQVEEKFNSSLYNSLLSKDQEIIDEYIPKMSAGEINSFMQRFVEHYPLEAEKEVLEVDEEKDSVVVFENSRITKNDSLINFIKNFISTTKSAEDINTFFADDINHHYVVENPEFYNNNSQVFYHITKYFHLNRNLRSFLESQKELNSFIWEGFRAYFENKKLYRGELYSYIGSVVNRKLRQGLDVGFICPFCSSYYTKDSSAKDNLISCATCQNRFSFLSVKCPDENCSKIVPITSIDTKIFDKSNPKHIRAFQSLTQYLNKTDMAYIGKMLDIPKVVDAYKIPLSTELQKKKLKKLTEYELADDMATSVPEFLFYLPLICPITTGHTRAKQKQDPFKGCGQTFLLKDGLRKSLKDDYFVYRLHDQRRIRYADPNKNRETYSDGMFSLTNDYTEENKLPYERIIADVDNHSIKVKNGDKKAMTFFFIALKKYFQEEYVKSIDIAVDSFLHNLSNDDLHYMSNIENYLADKQLQKNLFYKNALAYRVGWVPSNGMQERIREIYLELVQDREDFVRKIINAELPIKFYTYRISEIHNRPTTYKTRIGIAIDKSVLPATKRARAGYGQNFKMDKKFISVKLMADKQLIDISTFVKNGGYWSAENAALHGFDNKTGIIWFDGTPIDNERWELPDGLVVKNNSSVIVNITCAPDAFSKMYQRFDLNGKMRNIALQLETEGHI